jgi:hypothetical protein
MANDPLGNLRIAAPCPTSWEGMAGDERVRHCSLCSLNVYNFAEMTRAEVSELLLRTEGRICARLYRRADGRVITRDCPTGLRALRQRASRVAAAVVTAMLTLPAMAFGRTDSKSSLKTRGSRVAIEIEHNANAQRAAFNGVVRDTEGNALSGVTISVRDEAAPLTTAIVATTDMHGAFTLPGLNDGSYRLEVWLSGFTPARMEHLELKPGNVTHASVALQKDPVSVVEVGIIIMAPSNLTVEPGKVTVTNAFLNKIPF